MTRVTLICGTGTVRVPPAPAVPVRNATQDVALLSRLYIAHMVLIHVNVLKGAWYLANAPKRYVCNNYARHAMASSIVLIAALDGKR